MSPTMKVFFFLGAISLLYGGLKTDAADSSTDVALSRSLGLTVVLGAKQYYVGISQRVCCVYMPCLKQMSIV